MACESRSPTLAPPRARSGRFKPKPTALGAVLRCAFGRVSRRLRCRCCRGAGGSSGEARMTEEEGASRENLSARTAIRTAGGRGCPYMLPEENCDIDKMLPETAFRTRLCFSAQRLSPHASFVHLFPPSAELALSRPNTNPTRHTSPAPLRPRATSNHCPDSVYVSCMLPQARKLNPASQPTLLFTASDSCSNMTYRRPQGKRLQCQ